MKTIQKVKLSHEENILKQIRQALGLSQRQFAKAIGAGYQSVFRWENGKTKPLFSIAQIKKINILLQELGLTIDDLPDELE